MNLEPGHVVSVSPDACQTLDQPVYLRVTAVRHGVFSEGHAWIDGDQLDEHGRYLQPCSLFARLSLVDRLPAAWAAPADDTTPTRSTP